jgi:acyl carrier protein
MDLRKKLAMLEEMMDLSEGSLAPEIELADIDEWDSLAALSFVVLLKDEFDKKISGQEIRAFETVQDMLTLMEL